MPTALCFVCIVLSVVSLMPELIKLKADDNHT